MAMIPCPKCGQKISQSAKVCAFCNKILTEEFAAATKEPSFAQPTKNASLATPVQTTLNAPAQPAENSANSAKSLSDSVFNVVLFIIGLMATIFAFICFFKKPLLGYPIYEQYGGDAYTGIQHAAAATAKNVAILVECVNFGFGALLLVVGFLLIAVGIMRSKKTTR